MVLFICIWWWKSWLVICWESNTFNIDLLRSANEVSSPVVFWVIFRSSDSLPGGTCDPWGPYGPVGLGGSEVPLNGEPLSLSGEPPPGGPHAGSLPLNGPLLGYPGGYY